MDHSLDDSWPFWLSLGGKTSGECTGSIWLLSILIALCMGVLVGYSIIAHNWHQLEKLTSNHQGKEALRSLRGIFVLCAICGYGLVIVRSAIPAWSLTLICLCALNWVTWRYIFQLRSLEEIHRDANLLERMKREVAGINGDETPIETALRCKKLLDEHLQRINDGPQ